MEQSNSERIRIIHECLCRVKANEDIGVRYMQAWEERIYDKMEAQAEGRAEGRTEGQAMGETTKLISLICRKLQKGQSSEAIAEALEEELIYIEEICRIARSHAPEYNTEKIYEELMKEHQVTGG